LKRLDKPDYVMLDLDPKQAPWKNVLEVALVWEIFDEVGLTAFPKTSGSSGIHLRAAKPKRLREAAAIAGRHGRARAPKSPPSKSLCQTGEAGLCRCDAKRAAKQSQV
jgi:DNA primase